MTYKSNVSDSIEHMNKLRCEKAGLRILLNEGKSLYDDFIERHLLPITKPKGIEQSMISGRHTDSVVCLDLHIEMK